MAKRYQPMKEFGRTTKKPKLDISFHKGRPPQSKDAAQSSSRAAAAAPSTSKPRVPSPAKCSPGNNNNNYLWDDDDDDVILLATQVAETEAAATSHSSKSAPAPVVLEIAESEITFSEITFSEFAPHVPHASTSTQQPPAPPPASKTLAPDQDVFANMFGDDDDDDFLLAAAQVAVPPAQEQQGEVAFKMPTLPAPATATATSKPFAAASSACSSVSVNNTQTLAAVSSSQSAARRQLASERQIKFLMDRVDALKKENSKLNQDLTDNKEKMESKEGETALLRDELRHMKQQMQTLKMEKIFSTEAARTECKTKIAELAKKVETKETELQMKSVEFSILKTRHADETYRFQMSMRQDESMISCPARAAEIASPTRSRPTTTSSLVQKPNKRERRLLMRMRGLTLDNDEPSTSAAASSSSSGATDLNEHIYEPSHERGTSKKRRTLFQLELEEEIQTICAQLQLLLHSSPQLSEQQTRCYVEKTLASVRKVFPEFWSYVHSLEFLKNCRVHPQHEYDLRLDAGERISLHQPGEWHADERALSLRRYVAALSVVCRQLPPLSHALLSHRHGEYLLLQIASDAIAKLGFSRELCEHFGLLEAFVALLQSMLVQVAASDAVNASHVELLVGLLKQLVFTRPSAWIFRELSFCLLTCTHTSLRPILAQLCVNSAASTFVSDRVRSLYRFSNDSCLLQVYAGLLEIAFPLNTPLQPKHFELLTVICANHVRFVYACFANPPKFIHDLLPSYDTDDDDENEDTDNNNKDTGEERPNNSTVNSAFPLQTTSTNNSTTAVDGSSSSPCASVASAGSRTTPVETKAGENITCECYTKLCLSVVTLLFQVLHQWLRIEKSSETSLVAEISKISVQLLHIIFCDNYLTSLFRDAEETTKHYLCLICKWWSENAELLHFNEIHMNFLQKLQNSHVMPKQIKDEEQLDNIAVDLAEWYQNTSDDSTASKNNPSRDSSTNTNNLIEESGNAITFFEGLNGYAFNFQ